MVLHVRVEIVPLKLTPVVKRVLHSLDRYDLVVCTSKNARARFMEVLAEENVTLPPTLKFEIVGPRADLLTLAIDSKRILFPRSALAPYDIIRELRTRAASVRVLPLYTARMVSLTDKEQHALLSGRVTSIHFRSPSGVSGLISMFRGKKRKYILNIPVVCIGETTAADARMRGFLHVSVGTV